MRRILCLLAELSAIAIVGIGGQCNTNPPLTPIKPMGPDTTWVGDTTHYRTAAYSPDAHAMCFVFDWGDGSRYDTTAYWHSWDTVSVTRVWPAVGEFEVRAKAIDDRGVGSPGWSVPLSVTVHPPHTER